jgi:hypothetical protein
MARLKVPVNSPAIGECIYCGTLEEPLNREHAVPYGLSGPWTLLRASCSACATITHQFERDVLRELWLPVRAVLALSTRRRDKRPKTLPLILESSGVRRTIEVPLAQFPGYLPTPLFPPPGVVVGRPKDEQVDPEMQFRHVSGPTFEAVAARFPGTDFVGGRVTLMPEMYGRMLAKIAYCAAVHALGIAAVRKSPLRDVILGTGHHVFHWVGSWRGEPINNSVGLHTMQLCASGTDLHVILRLFAQFGAPEYHIVLGPADEDFVASSSWPWHDA